MLRADLLRVATQNSNLVAISAQKNWPHLFPRAGIQSL